MKTWQITSLWVLATVIVAVLSATLIPIDRVSQLLVFVFEVIALSAINEAYRKRQDRALDRLWALAAEQQLDAAALATRFPQYGQVDLELSKGPHRQFYPRLKAVNQVIRELEVKQEN